MTEPPQLREHKPDPMAAFRACGQFGEHGVINAVLRVGKPPQVERICAIG